MTLVKKKFDEAARNYDAERKMVIPHLDMLYTVAASLADMDSKSPEILDIGAGTGLLSSYLADKYPHAKITLIDFSEKMLDVARKRFHGRPNITYIADDYSRHEFDRHYDVVVSALSIHHLDDKEKSEFYRKCFDILNNGGIFINADIVLGSTANLDALYKNNWKSHISENIHSKDKVLEYYKRMMIDKEATLESQLGWLKKAGFKDVDCAYKYYNFAVMSGRKLP